MRTEKNGRPWLRIRSGTKRVAIILGSTLVIKIVFPTTFGRFLMRLPGIIRARGVSGIRNHFRLVLLDVRSGIEQNLSERRTWKKLRADFLAPAYVTCGILSVQRYTAGDSVTEKEMNVLLHSLGSPAADDARIVDPHSFDGRNFVRTPTGIVIVDYGDGKTNGMPFSAFLERFRSQIETVFCRTSNRP